jgi:hypothetical protein
LLGWKTTRSAHLGTALLRIEKMIAELKKLAQRSPLSLLAHLCPELAIVKLQGHATRSDVPKGTFWACLLVAC